MSGNMGMLTGKEEDEQGDERDLCWTAVWDKEGKSRGKERPGHVRECKEKEVSTAESIYGLS